MKKTLSTVLGSVLLLTTAPMTGCSDTEDNFRLPADDKIIYGEAADGGMASDEAEPIGTTPAFPGAEGGGMYTTGGRGGKILFVTKLSDDGSEGTLRWAINQEGPRTVLFKVSGLIRLKSQLQIKNGDLTIAGQSAPGDGICLCDHSVMISADNIIVRYLRFRMGDETKVENDAFWGRYHKNIIIDHCSMSWSTDECASFYGNENFTMQWCIISESLRNSVHGKGNHGYGGIWGGINASFHHNLMAHHDSRNPRFDHQALYPEYINRGNMDYRNNVIYNWGNNSTYGGEGGAYNMVNNYYKQGPASRDRQYFIITNGKYTGTIDGVPDVTTYPGHAHLYLSGNYYTPDKVDMNTDNWNGVTVQDDGGSTEGMHLTALLPIRPAENSCYVTTHSAEMAFERVLSYAGASLVRDEVDTRAVTDAQNGTATCMDGGNGSTNGIIDSQTAVGGWPTYNSLTAPIDTDEDGMPDDWEEANGLNKEKAGDAYIKTLDPNGQYTNLEMYLHSLVSATVSAQNEGGTQETLE